MQWGEDCIFEGKTQYFCLSPIRPLPKRGGKLLFKTVSSEATARLGDAISGTDGSEGYQQMKKELSVLTNSLKLLEAATGFEPVNNGFADRCLSHLAMPPRVFQILERETGFEPATTTLATWGSTS